MRTAEEVLKAHFNVMIDDIEVITDAMKEYAREAVKKRESQIFRISHGMGAETGLIVSELIDKLPEIELP